MAVADSALVDDGAVVRHLDRLADAGLASLHDAQLVGGVVETQRCHLVAREPLPATGEVQAVTWETNSWDRARGLRETGQSGTREQTRGPMTRQDGTHVTWLYAMSAWLQ